MKKIVHTMIGLWISFLLLSCDKDKIDAKVVLPTSIQTSFVIDHGAVNVNVTATNANFYSLSFFDGVDTVYLKSNGGDFTYNFPKDGDFEITSRAHTTETEFISEKNTISIVLHVGAPTSGYMSPVSYPNYNLVWSDEFTNSNLSSDWTFDIGGSGWGNQELQYYTNQNVSIQNGVLEIKAKKEAFGANNYTSTRLKTQGLKSWKYGRIDVRAALPFGKGIWPAIWMLGDNISSVGWPSCGEIDIMELVGGPGANDRTIHGTAHWEQNGHAQYGQSYSLSSGKFADEFHVFSIVWDANSIKWYVDDMKYNELSTTSAEMAEFQENFFLIFNVAVGGLWPGNPDETTVFPQSMYIDYVRVFQ